jgi:UPF0716 protein FxsA
MRIRVFPLLLALFVGLPLIDASLLVLLGRHVGFWQTVVLVIISGFAGAHLARSQGLQVWTGIRRDLSEGRMPSQGVMDGVLILFAGGMLAAPGFITDFLGLALLVPAVRAPIKALVRRRLERAIAEGRIVMLG